MRGICRLLALENLKYMQTSRPWTNILYVCKIGISHHISNFVFHFIRFIQFVKGKATRGWVRGNSHKPQMLLTNTDAVASATSTTPTATVDADPAGDGAAPPVKKPPHLRVIK